MIKDSGVRTELWKPVVGYEGFYEVSSLGRVKSLIMRKNIKDKQCGILRPKYDRKGYLRVSLGKVGKYEKSKTALVSRLVAEAFIPNTENLPMVGHDDDNKINNTVENLYWTDATENNNHNGKMIRFQQKHNEKIEQIANALSEPVIGTNIKTGEQVFFKSMQEAQRNGFKSGKVSMCCSGKRKSHKGYEWRKANND